VEGGRCLITDSETLLNKCQIWTPGKNTGTPDGALFSRRAVKPISPH
jgi:hypothetical protein